MGEDLVAAVRADRDDRGGAGRPRNGCQRVSPGFRGVVVEVRVAHEPDGGRAARANIGGEGLCGLADEHGLDRRRPQTVRHRPGQREGLVGGLRRHAAVVLDEDEDGAGHVSPNSWSRSTTAGAASAPVPRSVVSVTCSTGRTNPSVRCPPAGASAGCSATSAFLERRRPGSVG